MSATGAQWRTWGRSEAIRPARVERPASVGAVQRAVLAAGRAGVRLKPVGSGHSFSAIALAPGVQLDLGDLTGLVAVDERARHVTVAAGTRLSQLPAMLAPFGLAMENLGDIDAQTISGATSTGTHGTGGRYRGLAAQIVAASIVTANGELLQVSSTDNAELLPAIRVGLGALGVLVDITLQCVPTFLLHALERPQPLEAVIDSYVGRSAADDHFEFYWFPHTSTALTKTNTRLPAGDERHPLGRCSRWVDDELLANGLYRAVCAVGSAVPAVIPPINKIAQKLIGNREFTDASTSVFVTHRGVRFQEMEYALPREAVPDALHDVKRLIESRGWRISFPIEVRSAAADENWLSTAYGRDTGYIAVHRYHRENPEVYFRAVEEIMKAYDGRPHWGKMHYRDAVSLRESYPRFDDFTAVRDRLDPDRMFANAYLKRVLGA